MSAIFKVTQYSDTEGRMLTRYQLCSGTLPDTFTEFVGYFKHTFAVRPGEPGMPFDLTFPIILGSEGDKDELESQAVKDDPGERVLRAFQAFDASRDEYIPVWEEKMREHVDRQVEAAVKQEKARQEALQAAQKLGSGERHIEKGDEDSLIQRG